jgi:hypothetical protein
MKTMAKLALFGDSLTVIEGRNGGGFIQPFSDRVQQPGRGRVMKNFRRLG